MHQDRPPTFAAISMQFTPTSVVRFLGGKDSTHCQPVATGSTPAQTGSIMWIWPPRKPSRSDRLAADAGQGYDCPMTFVDGNRCPQSKDLTGVVSGRLTFLLAATHYRVQAMTDDDKRTSQRRRREN